MDYLNTLLNVYSMYEANESAGDAAKSARTAAGMQAQGQGNALDYLKATDMIPMNFRNQAYQTLGGLYNLEGGIGSQEDMISRAEGSPLYASIMGNQSAGEESIMRNASMTGGLRSGNTQEALAEFNTNLKNKALLTSYNDEVQGLTGLTNVNGNENSIANLMAAIGSTNAGGELGAAAAEQTGAKNMLRALSGASGDISGLLKGLKDAGVDVYDYFDSGEFGNDWDYMPSAGETWDASADWAGDTWNDTADWAGDTWDSGIDWGADLWNDSGSWFDDWNW